MGPKKVKRLEIAVEKVEKRRGIEVCSECELSLSDNFSASIRSCQVRFCTLCSPTFESLSLPVPRLSVKSGPRWPQIPGFGMLSESLSPSHAGVVIT